MKHSKKLILLNIIIPIILFTILLFVELSEKFISIMSLTFVVGWAIPYFTLILTGIALFNRSHKKLGLTINIFNSLLLVFLISLVSSILERHLIIVLVEYIILLLISLLNIIVFTKDLKNNPDPEIAEISRTKKANNGIIK